MKQDFQKHSYMCIFKKNFDPPPCNFINECGLHLSNYDDNLLLNI